MLKILGVGSLPKFSDEWPGMKTPKAPLPMPVTNKEIKMIEGSKTGKLFIFLGTEKDFPA